MDTAVRQRNLALLKGTLLTALASTGALALPGLALAKLSPGPRISRPEVLGRAHAWITKGVIYDGKQEPSPWPIDNGRTYRRDCSGFVSMALRLPSDPNTVGLIDVLKAISWRDLRPGDVVGVIGPGTSGNNGHVVVFESWVNESALTFKALEMSSTGQRAKVSVRNRNFGKAKPALPYRYINITG